MQQLIDPQKLRRILVTDCGSTTTKALLFELTSNGWRQTARGEAPTTVEEPVADVTVGACNAFREVQELAGLQLLQPQLSDADVPFLLSSEQAGATLSNATQGIDLYLSTSSAGGGLQMMVAGIVGQMSVESAARAALGAGAIVLDSISLDDARKDFEKIERIRHLRPDIVLLTGGVDGGAKQQVIELAEILVAASPKPRFGKTLQLPVIYAGNAEAAAEVQELLSRIAQVIVVPNVRPQLESENLGPAREAIHEIFLTHVMSHSPGYDKLLSWSPRPVMPTPAAVGDVVQSFAKQEEATVLCADIGGATTDVFSVFRNTERELIYNRTVSANYGMSYSIANVLVEAGVDNIKRWLPFAIEDAELRDRLRNKMIRPTSIPQTLDDLWIEQAVCREALRLSLEHHRSLAVGLAGRQQQRGISDIFAQKTSRYQLVDLRSLDVVIGSGGVLSHAPRRIQAALMMLDGFALEGISELTVDSIFMMPHLGVLAALHPTAAHEIFRHDCLVRIAHAIVAVPKYPLREAGATLARVLVDREPLGEIRAGLVQQITLPVGKKCTLEVQPISGVDVGGGPGQARSKEIVSGQLGLLLDGRGRPLVHASTEMQRIQGQRELYTHLEMGI
jgi:uncharacterized protein (TIGR01319 family)